MLVTNAFMWSEEANLLKLVVTASIIIISKLFYLFCKSGMFGTLKQTEDSLHWADVAQFGYFVCLQPTPKDVFCILCEIF